MEVGRQFLKNIFASWAGFGQRVLITFFFTPFITGHLSEARYGAWVIIFATLDYLSMVDIGMKQALVRFISKSLGEKNYDRVNQVLNTATAIYLVLAVIVFSLAMLVVYNFELIIQISDPVLLEETRGAMFVVALQITVFFLLLPFANTLGAFHRFDISNGQMMISELVRVAALVYLLANGYGLVEMVWAIFIIGSLRQIWSMWTLKRLHPQVKLQLSSVNRDMAEKLLHYSKISFMITVMWLVIFRADAYILGGMVAVAAAGIYAPASQLFHYFRNLINTIGTPLVPVISHLEVTNRTGYLSDIYLKGVKYISFVTSLFAVGCLFYARDFVGLWLKPEFAPAGTVMMILAVPAAVFLPQIVGNSILFGTEKHKRLLYVLAVEALLKIVLSIVLVERYGLLGLAYGTAIPQLLVYGIIYPQVMKRSVGVSVGKIYLNLVRSAVYAAGVAIPVALAMRSWFPPLGWGAFFLNVSAVVLLTAPVGFTLLEPDDRQRLRDMIRRKQK